MLADADAEKVFRLLNPEILGLPHEDEGCKIKDEQQMASVLAKFIGRFSDGVYEDQLVRLQLAGLSLPDLVAYRDADTLEVRIAEQEDVLARERQLLDAAVNSEQLQREKERLRREGDAIRDRLHRYQEFQKRLPLVKQLSKEKIERENRKDQLERQLVTIAERRPGQS